MTSPTYFTNAGTMYEAGWDSLSQIAPDIRGRSSGTGAQGPACAEEEEEGEEEEENVLPIL